MRADLAGFFYFKPSLLILAFGKTLDALSAAFTGSAPQAHGGTVGRAEKPAQAGAQDRPARAGFFILNQDNTWTLHSPTKVAFSSLRVSVRACDTGTSTDCVQSVCGKS